MALRVAFALATVRPGMMGGVETSYVRNLLREFVSGNGPDEVLVLANAEVEEAYANQVGGPARLWPVKGMSLSGGRGRRALTMLRGAALPARRATGLKQRVDVVHYPVVLPIPRVDAPTVMSLHDVAHLEEPRMFSSATRAYRKVAYEATARRAAMVVTATEHARASIIEHLRIDPERIVSIPHGIDSVAFTPADRADDELLAPYGLPERFLVYPANMWPHKNHERLLEAFARTRDPEVTLVLTGEAYGKLDELLLLARRLGIEHRIRHLGHVPAAVIPALYRRALALVFPSLYEGFGLPPLEAMACGCPVASSRAGSLEEVCGGDAVLFDPRDEGSIANAIDQVASDPLLRDRLRVGGPARAARFDWSTSARKYLEVYERVAAGG